MMATLKQVYHHICHPYSLLLCILALIFTLPWRWCCHSMTNTPLPSILICGPPQHAQPWYSSTQDQTSLTQHTHDSDVLGTYPPCVSVDAMHWKPFIMSSSRVLPITLSTNMPHKHLLQKCPISWTLQKYCCSFAGPFFRLSDTSLKIAPIGPNHCLASTSA